MVTDLTGLIFCIMTKIGNTATLLTWKNTRWQVRKTIGIFQKRCEIPWGLSSVGTLRVPPDKLSGLSSAMLAFQI